MVWSQLETISICFCWSEDRIENNHVNVADLLKNAERNWIKLDDDNILMEEMKNNGDWVRSWRRAFIEYSK
jgi:hypothetical protein